MHIWFDLMPSFHVLSLKQMELSDIDLKKIEEETKMKIAAINADKVSIVAAFMAQIKVMQTLVIPKGKFIIELEDK